MASIGARFSALSTPNRRPPPRGRGASSNATFPRAHRPDRRDDGVSPPSQPAAPPGPVVTACATLRRRTFGVGTRRNRWRGAFRWRLRRRRPCRGERGPSGRPRGYGSRPGWRAADRPARARGRPQRRQKPASPRRERGRNGRGEYLDLHRGALAGTDEARILVEQAGVHLQQRVGGNDAHQPLRGGDHAADGVHRYVVDRPGDGGAQRSVALALAYLGEVLFEAGYTPQRLGQPGPGARRQRGFARACARPGCGGEATCIVARRAYLPDRLLRLPGRRHRRVDVQPGAAGAPLFVHRQPHRRGA